MTLLLMTKMAVGGEREQDRRRPLLRSWCRVVFSEHCWPRTQPDRDLPSIRHPPAASRLPMLQ